MSASTPGLFITLEGGEGVGKSTQLGALSAALRARGLDVLETREPGGSPGAEAIRELLLHRQDTNWAPRAEALLFAAARSDHIRLRIAPALARGQWVLCDRFVDSTRAYQGGTDGLTDADILALHGIGSGGLMPDRTLLLALPADVRRQRREERRLGRADRFEERPIAYHEAVAAAFDRLAEADPVRIRRVDASGAPDAVTARLVDELQDLLP